MQLSLYPGNTLVLPALFLFLSLTGEQGAHTLFTDQRERERKREGERIRNRERGREREMQNIFKRNDRCLGTF
jgi:hypothetical protein